MKTYIQEVFDSPNHSSEREIMADDWKDAQRKTKIDSKNHPFPITVKATPVVFAEVRWVKFEKGKKIKWPEMEMTKEKKKRIEELVQCDFVSGDIVAQLLFDMSLREVCACGTGLPPFDIFLRILTLRKRLEELVPQS